MGARTAPFALLLGAPDLDRAVASVERLTGVKAATGGSHSGMGTRNALVSLGGQQYLEIIAPDPRQTSFSFQTDIRTLAEPKLIGWAARTNDIVSLAKRTREGGNQIFAGAVHPAQDSPKGCQLQSFEIEHPDPVKRLGIQAEVKLSKGAGFAAVLSSPKGRVELR
ncbi:MAG: VOC family protein [Acidobacteriia bacterium]|nr:VOC family protein [Terriglobia bacterium]